MKDQISKQIKLILDSFNPTSYNLTASLLKTFWLEFEPNRGIELIKEEQRRQQESSGTPIPILKLIGKEISKYAIKDVANYIVFAQALWEEYGREGRVISSIVFGKMELVEPKRIIPILKENCRECISWEDADRLAMDALEPIIRIEPEVWISELDDWLQDESKWLRRAAITVYGRLPMKHPGLLEESLKASEKLLYDESDEVRKATSFAIRICAKSDAKKVCTFLSRQIPPKESSATWVLCDVIRSMGSKQIVEFKPLLLLYKKWISSAVADSKDVRSIGSAIKRLEGLVQNSN